MHHFALRYALSSASGDFAYSALGARKLLRHDSIYAHAMLDE